MGLALFIPIMLMLLIGVYVGCFKDEFDNENLNTVWAVVGVIIIFLVLWAILASFGGSGNIRIRGCISLKRMS